MYLLPRDILAELILSSDLDSLVVLSSTDKTLNTLLKDKYTLEQLAILHEIPFVNSLSEARKFGELSLDRRMIEAVKKGDKASVLRMITLGATKYNWAMVEAARGGYTDIVQMMLDLDADDYNSAMALAARGGYTDIIKLLRDWQRTHRNI